ncbi:glycosyltransferase family 15 protein, partial [Suhomyces tanzawaensis NRRL Y-17324]
RQNATFLILCRNSDVFALLDTLQNLEDRHNHQFHYDYTFLNDVPFDPEVIHLISSYIPQGKLNFGVIPSEHWSYPPHIDVARAQHIHLQSAHIPYGDSESYRHMCRFFSGFFYRHPLVAQYRYYWRLEPGVKYYCNIDQDLFAYMRENKKTYGFTVSLFEYLDTIPTLWDTVKAYMHEFAPRAELLGLVQNDDQWQSYNLCHFWSNFEIADLSLFHSPEYQHFFEYLDASGGFYYERWGDAPVHTMAIVLFLQKSDIHWFHDFGYYHPPFTQCPLNPAVFVDKKCTCDPDEDFTYGFLSCTPHFLEVM